MKNITIIDTFGFLFRSYYALPPLKSKNGFPTGLLTGFMNFILNIGKDFQTDYIVFALDSKGDTFRNEIYPLYKAHRPDVPEDLLAQLPIAIQWIEEMGFTTVAQVGLEADDIIASLAQDAKNKGLEVRVVSHDKDLYQLIEDEKIYLFDPIKKTLINNAKCYEKYGVHANQFTDYQSLLGDSADNVPGVKGVGAKTAEALIKQFGTLDNIYENLDQIEKPRWIKLLSENKELAFISKELVTLKTDACVLGPLEPLLLPTQNPVLKIENRLLEYDLRGIINRVHQSGLNYKTQIPKDSISKFEDLSPKNIEFEDILLDTKEKLLEVIKQIPKDSIIAFDTETTDIDTRKAKLVGFSFSYEENKAYYIPISHYYLGVGDQVSLEDTKEAILLLNNFKLIVQNYKYDYNIILNNLNIKLSLYADSMVLAWILDPGTKVGLDSLALKYFDHKMIAFKDVVKKGEDFSNIDLLSACKYASEDALLTLKIYYKLLEEFKTKDCENLLKLAFDNEFYFIKVLNTMENYGIRVDIKLLEELKIKNHQHLKELSSKIYELAGLEFNINSPKQLGLVLFETLNLPALKKTKTGYSTNEAVLSKLVDKHEIISVLLDYRESFKLQSTYIEPLLELGLKNPENTIHTSFLQTGTATGRLSSKNPNLQNIPVKSEAGRKIREAFVARKGYKLVGVDYSQIELRLLAHFSQDEALVEAFNKGLDIHTQTAIKIFGEELAPSKRNIAKSINFGLIYGMGSRKLAETLGINSKDAKSYIESYFEAFSSVKGYLKSIEETAVENGFVNTIINRRRNFDFSSVGGMQRAAFLREAVNTVFQGSAADLIKLSMNEIDKRFKENDNIKMLLQIHDELIFEIKEEEVHNLIIEIKDIMTNVLSLSIPLDVSVCTGNSWGELK